MAKKTEKALTDVKEFIASINKKDEHRNGKRIRFNFVRRKRK